MVEEEEEEGEMKNIESDAHARPGGLCAAFPPRCEPSSSISSQLSSAVS